MREVYSKTATKAEVFSMIEDATANLIAAKFKITVSEANGTYDTLLSMLNKDGRLPLKVVHGYLDILRRERPIPADVDPQKFLDFSMLPGGK